MKEYQDAIDEAGRSVQKARDIFHFKSCDWDDDWCLDKFDAILDLLDIVRGFLDV